MMVRQLAIMTIVEVPADDQTDASLYSDLVRGHLVSTLQGPFRVTVVSLSDTTAETSPLPHAEDDR